MAFTWNKSPYLTLIGIVSVAIASVGLWFWANKSDGIYDYNKAKDREFILELFKVDKQWLLSTPDYSPEHMLETKSSSKAPANLGNLTIKTYRHCGKPVGFIAYYKKKSYEGFVLFLAVDRAERGKGYARKLMEYALNDLKKRNCTIVTLITRVTNLPAQRVYKGMGFEQIWSDDEYIRFKKNLT